MTRLLFILAALVAASTPARAMAADVSAPDRYAPDLYANDLYYATDALFPMSTPWEARVSAGYDFSNPYLNLFALGVSGYRLIDRSFAVGIEVTGFGSSLRRSAQALSHELGDYGMKLDVVTPEVSAAAVARWTVVSGMVNFLSLGPLMAEISLDARAGTLEMRSLPLGPLFGTGLEVALRAASNWGFDFGLLWDTEKPMGRDWESRVGFRAGPIWRF